MIDAKTQAANIAYDKIVHAAEKKRCDINNAAWDEYHTIVAIAKAQKEERLRGKE